jgi:hypothetical protein
MHLLVGLLAATSLASAQEPKKAQAAGGTQAPVAAKEAALPRFEPDPILLHVTGLTKDNQSAVKDALTAMSGQRYVCTACKHEQATPGPCPACKTDLHGEPYHLLSAATVLPDAASITVIPTPNAMVKLSEIESALAKNTVHVDPSRLSLPGRATLVLKDAGADSAPTIEKALKDAKLFAEVHSLVDPIRGLELEVRAGPTAPTRSNVAKALEAAGTRARLTDVIWGESPRRA